MPSSSRAFKDKGLPALLFILAFLPFLPAVPGGLFWDDIQNLRGNTGYLGFDWTHVRWMATATWMGHYTPLVWLSFAADHAFWDSQWAGWRLTNILLHAFNAVLVYFLARRLLALAAEEAVPEPALSLGSAFAALLFALHPLRVESVAWLTERRDVLSSAFLFGAVLVYLRACRERTILRWVFALILFECSLLSKESGVTLPAVLLVLDVYPLRRLGGDKGWAVRPVWLEKGMFFIAALPTLVLTPLRVYRSGSLVTASKLGIAKRLTIFCYGLAFYARKTLWPAGLAPFYPLPKTEAEALGFFAPAIALVVVAAVAAWVWRRRYPALAAAELAYAIILTPVAGLVQNGPQIAADRYSYVACLPWALLAGGALLWALRSRAARPGALLVAGCVCAVLGWETSVQASYWADPAALWRRDAALFPDAALPRVYLAEEYAREGKTKDAEAAYKAALGAEPDSATAHESYGAWLLVRGRKIEAERELRRSLALDPGIADTHELLGQLLEARGDGAAAEQDYARAAALAPDDPRVLLDDAGMLLEQGRFGDAADESRRAALLEPGSAPAHYDLALALAEQGKTAEAMSAYAEAVRLDPGYVAARVNYGNLLARAGRPAQALEQYHAALRLEPGSPGAHYNLGALLEAEGDTARARAEYESALKARPGYREAKEGLSRLSLRAERSASAR